MSNERSASSGGLIKIVLALAFVGLVAVGALAAVIATQLAGGDGANIIEGLEAEHTVGAVGVSGLHEFGAQLTAAVKKLPAEARKKAGLSADGGGLTAMLGFDPATTDGWRKIGLDASSGAAIVIDTRVMRERRRRSTPAPILLAKITDLDALLTFVKSKGVRVGAGKPSGQWTSYEINGRKVLVGAHDDNTAILLLPRYLSDARRVALTARFASFLSPAGKRLGDDAAFETGFQELTPGGTVFGWGSAAPALAALTALGANDEARQALAFYADMITALAVHGGAAGTVARAVTSDSGNSHLRKLLRPKHSGPNFAARIPRKGWAVAGLAINLDEVFEGVTALAPPTLSSRESAVLAGLKGLVAVGTGIGWDTFTEALSGHACVGADIASVSATAMSRGRTLPRALAMVGVRDAGKADALLSKLINLARGVRGLTVKEIEVGGNKGYALELGRARAHVIRAEGMLLAAQSGAALKAAIERDAGESLKGTALAAALNDDVAASFGMDVTPLLDLAPLGLTSMRGRERSTAASMLSDLRAKLAEGEPYSFVTLKLDDDGVVLNSHAPGGAELLAPAVTGVLAAVALPQFMRYQRRAKAAEANEMLDLIKKGAAMYYTTPRVARNTGVRLPCRFPPSVATTPSAVGCCGKANDSDEDGRCDAKPAAWNNPTWAALKFSLTDQHYFVYRFESSGEGPTAMFTATANADLDCDGTFSTFQLVGTAKRGSSGLDCEMGTSAIFRDMETE